MKFNLPEVNTLNGILDRNIPKVDPATQTQIYYIKLVNYNQLPENLNVIVKIPYLILSNAY